MRCHVCNAEVGDQQRFCHECGESLSGVTDPTEALDMQTVFESADADGESIVGALAWSDATSDATSEAATDVPVDSVVEAGDHGPADHDADDDADDDGVLVAAAAAATTAVPLMQPPADPAATTTMDEVPAAADAAATTTLAASAGTTDEYGSVPGGPADPGQHPPVFDAAVDFDPYPTEPEGFRFRLTLVLGVLAVLTAALTSFADVTDVRTDRVVPGIDNRLRTLDDIGSNLAIAAFIGAAVLLIGGVLHCFDQRWAAGLAGGAGLALAGWAAATIGLAEVPIGQAERVTRETVGLGPFILTVTRDVGYWLIVGLGVLGLATFLLSLVSAGSAGRAGLDPWTAALGALGGVIAAAGPLVPVGDQATFSSNFGVNGLATMFFAGRLVQVGLLAAAAMLGFLLVRRYGLGLAAGGLSIPTFMWLTTLLDVGDAPIGIAVGNLGTSDIAPHAVTTVGMSVALVMLVAAAVIAAVRTP